MVVLALFSSRAFAQEDNPQPDTAICTYNQDCTLEDGTAGVQSCSGVQGDAGCGFDISVESNCSACRVKEVVSPASEEDEVEPVAEQPARKAIDNPPSVTTTNGVSREENAVYKVCSATTPKELCKEVKRDDGIFSQIVNALSGLVLFFTKPQNEAKLYSQSESVHNGRLPIVSNNDGQDDSEDVKGVTEDIVNNFKGFLGGSSGFYGAYLPKFDSDNDIKESELEYEKAAFPEGIHPVTGQSR